LGKKEEQKRILKIIQKICNAEYDCNLSKLLIKEIKK